MQVSLTATGGLERRLEVAVPATEVDTEVEQRLKNISRTARLKGFRPGKAPITVVRKQFGEQVHAEVISDLMRSSFAQALSQEKLTPAGGPRIEPITMGPGTELGRRDRRRHQRDDREHAATKAGIHCGRAACTGHGSCDDRFRRAN